ncbi:MAG: type IV secretory system conjugative DNA transfer family protein [Fusobacterium sp.]|nr:type IV secretory system conjugative DNA transfer family protein [Fusobacterium sp.]
MKTNLKPKEVLLPLFRNSFIFLLLEICVATYYFADKFNYHKSLKGLYILGNHIYFPLSYIFWAKRLASNAPKTIESINSFIIMGLVVFAIIQLIIITKKETNNVHGSARWATQAEVKAMDLYKEHGAVLGCDATGKLLKDNGDKHIFMAAPTRGGKGINSVTPTAFDWNKSLVVNDIKGELWGLTSGYRKNVLKQKVFMFCPVDLTGTSCSYNPLDFIAIGTGAEIEDVTVIAQTLIDTEGKGESDHWISSAMNLLIGVLLHVKYAKKNASLIDVIEFITPTTGSLADRLADILGIPREDEEGLHGVVARSGGEFETDEDGEPLTDELGQELYTTKGHATFNHLEHFENKNLFKEVYSYEGTDLDVDCKLHPIVAREFMSLFTTPDKERGSIISTATQKLKIFLDPIIAKHIKYSDFTFRELMDEKCTLYLVTPPKSISRTRPLLRLIFTQIVFQLTDRMSFDTKVKKKNNLKVMIDNQIKKTKDYFYPEVKKEKNQILLLIDEFPSLQKLDIIEQSMSYIAGYGLKCFLIAQSLKQFKKIYGKDNYILDNCSTQIFLTPNDEETPKMISDMFDTYTEEVVSKSRKGMDFMPTLSTSYVARKLMTAGEVRTLPYEDILLMMTGQKPIRGKKLFYFRDKRYEAKKMPCLTVSDKKIVKIPKELLEKLRDKKTEWKEIENINLAEIVKISDIMKTLENKKNDDYVEAILEIDRTARKIILENKPKIEQVKIKTFKEQEDIMEKLKKLGSNFEKKGLSFSKYYNISENMNLDDSLVDKEGRVS